MLIPLSDEENASPQQIKNAETQRDQLRRRYYDAPDLQQVGRNAYRFLNAVSDYATHAQPLRKTKNYRENLFDKVIEGHPLLDKAYELVKQAV